VDTKAQRRPQHALLSRGEPAFAGWSGEARFRTIGSMTRKRAVLDQLNIVVHDMAATTAFYARLGVEIQDTLPAWQNHHRTLDGTGALDIDLDSAAFAAQWNAGWPPGSAGVVIGFRVATRDDVDALYQELTDAGHNGQQPPYDAFFGARYAIVEDPSGNAIGLMSPVDPERRTRPPDPPNP
jgi:uncharacterized glyoxalase superfamily protein PhnB